MEKYYPGEPVNINILSLLILSRINIGKLPPKKGKGELPLFCGNREQAIPIYGLGKMTQWN